MIQAIIRILRPVSDRHEAVGAGCFVAPRHAITCAHVVADALGLIGDAPPPPDAIIRLDLPLVPGQPQLRARVQCWLPARPAPIIGSPEDIAVLELLEGEAALPVAPAPLVVLEPAALLDRDVRVCGFPPGVEQGEWQRGWLRGPVASGWVQLDPTLGSRSVRPGYSGAPVIDRAENAVVGMLVAAQRAEAATLAYLLPAATLLRACPALDAHSRPANPYRGLLAFREADAGNYFGREPDVADVLAAVERQPLVAVVGPSGSGKSSLAFAGVAAALRGVDGWQIAAFRPRTQPQAELARSLIALWDTDPVTRLAQAAQLVQHWAADAIPLAEALHETRRQCGAERLLLIADQFEELYTQGVAPAQIERVLELLVSAVEAAANEPRPDLCLLLTLRADFLGHALAHQGLARLLDRYPKKLLAPVSDPQRLRAIIERPAEQAGVAREDLLAERLLRDLAELPGDAEAGASLPLLEFTLEQLWARQHQRRLTHLDYEAIGGIHQALARHADGVYAQLDAAERAQLRHILVQLVHPGEGTEDTRQVATRAQLSPEYWPLVTRLADQRLIVTGHDETTGEDTAELIHEALIRHWRPLREWLDEDRAFRTWQNRLRQSLAEWQACGQESDALLRGSRLAEAEERLAAHREILSDAEQGFIVASLAERERVAGTKRRRTRFTIAALGAGLAFASLLSLWAIMQQNRALQAETSAQVNAQIAQRQEALAISRQLAAQAKLVLTSSPSDPVKGTLLAIESLREAQTLEAYDAWTTAMRLLPRGVRRLEHRESVDQIEFTPDGSRLAAVVSDGTTAAGRAQLWDVASGELLSSFEHDGWIADAEFSPDGQWIAIGSWDHSLVIADAETGKSVRRLARADAVSALAFSPDGSRLAIGEKDGLIQIVDPPSGSGITTMQLRDRIKNLAWSDDGLRLAAASEGGVAALWQSETGEQSARLEYGGNPSGLTFSPSGTRLVAWHQDSQSYPLFDIETGLVADSVPGQFQAFTPEGSGLLTGSEEKLVLSDAATGSELAAWPMDGYVWGVGLDQERTTAAIALNVGQVVILDFDSGIERHRLQNDRNCPSVALSPNGKLLAAASGYNLVRVLDAASGEELLRLPVEGENCTDVQFSPDGRRLLTTTRVSSNYGRAWGEVALWDAMDWSPGGQLAAAPMAIRNIAFDKTGENVAVVRWDQTIQVVSTKPGEELARLAFDDTIWSARFLENDRLLVELSGQNHPIDIYDIRTGRRISRLSDVGGVDYVAIDGAGRRIATTFASESTLRIWDAASGTETHHFETGCCMSPNGQRYLRTADGLIEVRDVETDGLVSRIRSGISNPVQLLVSPNGRRLAIHAITEVELWDIESEMLIARITHPYPRPLGRAPFPDEPQYQPIAICRFSPDGRFLATHHPRQPLRIWDADTGQKVRQIGATNQGVSTEFAFTPDGRLVATVSTERNDVSIWDSQTDARVGLLESSGFIVSSAFSPDGTRLVISVDLPDSGGTVQVWNVAEERLLYEFPYSERYRATAVALSHNGPLLAVGGYDAGAGVVVWDLKTGKKHARLQPDARVETLAFAADDTRLIMHDTTYSVRIWDLATGVEKHRIGRESGFEQVAHDGRGRRLATATEARVGVWDTKTAQEILSLRRERDVWHWAMTRDGALLALAGQDSSLIDIVDIDRAVDANDSSQAVSLTLDHGAVIEKLAFSADARFLVSAGTDGKVRIWDLQTGDETTELEHHGSIEKLAISDDDSILASYISRGNDPSEVVLWRRESGEKLLVVPLEVADLVTELRFRPGTHELAIAGRDGILRIVDAAPARPERSSAALGGRVFDADISPSGALVAIRRSDDPVVEVRDVATGSLVTTVAHEDDVWGVAFSPDGKTLATRGKDQTTRLWDPTAGTELLRVDHPEGNGSLELSPSSEQMLFWRPTSSEWEEDHLEVRDTRSGEIIGRPITGFVGDVVFSPDGRYLAMGSGEYASMKEIPYSKRLGFFGLWIWDIEAGQEVRRLPHEDGIFHVHFAPDGALLASTDHARKSIWLWDRRDAYRASELARTRGNDVFDQIAFGPDGRTLAAQSDKELTVWNLSERAVVSRLEGSRLGPFTFSPDGRLIAVKADDGAWVWDWQSDQLLARIEDVDEMRFTPDSRRLVVVHDDDHVRIWEIGVEDLVAEACSRLERNLTLAEWRAHRGDEPYRRSCEKLPKPVR